MAICPIHNHSNYSRLDGLSTVEEIANRAIALDIESIALTDHDFVSGHIDFYKTISKHDLKPILGIETYQAPVSRLVNAGKLSDKERNARLDNFHLILLAQNNEGLRNLWRMNTEAHRTGFYYNGRVDWELLEKFSEGVICTSACALGMLAQYVKQGQDYELILQKYLSIFGDRFYIELGTYDKQFQYDSNVELVSLAKRWGIPMIYGNDAHYAYPEQYELHEAILSVQYNQKLAELEEPHHEPCLYIMEEDDVRKHLSYLPTSVVNESLANTVEIAKQVSVSLPAIRNRVPAFIPEKGWSNSWDMFFDLVKDGYQEKIIDLGKDNDEYFQRLSKELDVIKTYNLFDYFLIVRDYIQAAKDMGVVVGPGRGSIGGSLVAYCLGITTIDSVQYGLIFERFFNKGRAKSKPDIDNDFSAKGRERVKEYVSKKYGPTFVSELGTNLTLKGKGAVNDLARVMGIPLTEARKITEIIDRTVDAGIQSDWQHINEKVGYELEPYKRKYPQLFQWAERLYDHIRGYGVHASGVIIGDEELDGVYPMRWVAKDKKLVTQWPMEIAEEFGYMKMDFLSLRTLDTLEEVNNILKEDGKQPIDFDEIQNLFYDEGMWEILDKGLTVGLFQIEDGGMAKNIAKQMQCRSIDDLAALVALNRPGPLESGDIQKYIEGRNGVPPRYLNKFVENVTKETYGVFIYQEQIINFMQQVGYSLEQADNFRAVMGKKKVSEIDKERVIFFDKAKDHMTDYEMQTLWNIFENFSKYGFNKSHAVGYGIMLLRTLFVKYYFPKEFILAGIRTVDKTQVKRYLNEAKRMGIVISPPHLNKSDVTTRIINDGSIQFGLGDMKYFSASPARWIIDNRPFQSYETLLDKIKENKITLFNGSKRVALTSRHLDILNAVGGLEGLLDVPNPVAEDDKFLAQEEYIGVAFSDKTARILEQYSDEVDIFCTPIPAIETSGEYRIAGVISEAREAVAKSGSPYMVLTIKDPDENDIRVHVWSRERDRFKFMCRRNIVGLFDIKKNDRWNSLTYAKMLHDKDQY